MSSVPKGSTPVFGTRSILVGFVLAALLAFAYMATAAAGDASARDIVISDSSSPLSAGAAGPNFAGTAITAGSPAQTQTGNCLSPNVSIRPSAAGPAAAADVQAAIQAAVNPVDLGVQAGDNVYFCNVAATGTGTPAANTYAPAESATAGQAIDLSVTPSITIGAYPGQTPILQANQNNTEHSFFVDSSTQGRNFVLEDLILTQAAPLAGFNGGFIRISNAVNPGNLELDGIAADGFSTDGAGGVVAAENVDVGASLFGTSADNSAGTSGGAIDADGDVDVTLAEFGDLTAPATENTAGTSGGAIAAGGNIPGGNVTLTDVLFEGNVATANDGGAVDAEGTVVVDSSDFTANDANARGGAINSDGAVSVSSGPSTFAGDGTAAAEAGDGGAIAGQSVTVANASRFGVDTTSGSPVGAGLDASGDGGAIYTFNTGAGAGCDDANPATPCIAGTVDVTGAAVFGDNTAASEGGAIYAAGGLDLDGTLSGAKFTSTATYVNEASGGGAIAVGGLFAGNTALVPPIPRACVSGSSVTNLNLSGQVGGAVGGGAILVLGTASDSGAPPADATKTCAVDLSGNTYSGNKVVGASSGGALQINGGTVDIGDSTFTGNLVGVTNAGVITITTDGLGGAVATGGANTAVVNDTGSVYSGNLAGLNGGAVYVAGAGKTVNISEVEMTGNLAAQNSATGRGGAIAQVGAANQAVTVEKATLTSNTAGNGGAVSQSGSAGALDLVEVEFDSNSVGAGTAPAAPGAGVANSPATGNGGAVFLATTLGGTASTLIDKAEFTDNAAGTNYGWGGAVFQLSGGVDFPATAASGTSNTVIQEALFEGNSALGATSGKGGAISSVAFGGNPAGAAGPPVIPPTFNMAINEVALVDNIAQDDGGAINLGYTFNNPAVPTFYTTPVLVTNSAADGNRAVDGAGGTVYGDVASAFLAGEFDPVGQSITEDGIAVIDSKSGTNGGGIASVGGTVVLIGSEFAGNKNGQNAAGTGIGTAAGNTGARGGAVSFIPAGGPNSANYLVLGSQFVSNESAKDGGAIYTTGNGNFLAPNYRGIGISAFAFNSAGKANTLANQEAVGGAVAYASGAASTQVTLSNLFIANNVTQTNTNAAANSFGGAIGSVDAGAVTSYRDTFASNEVSAASTATAAAGAIYAGGANNITATNSTFNGNSSSGPASVAWTSGAGTLSLVNSTVAGNGSPLVGGSLLQTAAGTTGTIAIRNSILAEGIGTNSECKSGAVSTPGGNVLTTETDCAGNTFVGGGGAPATKVTDAELDLQPLANNGNSFSEDLPLSTMALGFDSVARSSSATCTGIGLDFFAAGPVDERGLTRPNTNCSSGAYQLSTQELTVSKAGSGKGTVVSDPAGIDCGPDCNSETSEFADVPPVLTVTLTATPQAGSAFVSWSGPCVSVTANSCEVTMDGTKFVTANFQNTQNTLTVAKVGNGDGKVTSSPAGIDCGTSCVANYNAGTTVTLTAAAEGQSTFDGWSGACASAGDSATCTVTMDQSKTASANFTQTARARIVKVKQGTIRVPSSRKIQVGRVECVNGNCEVVQATARVTARGRTFTANVNVNRDTFTTGQSRTATVVVPKAAYKRLRSSKSGRVSLVLRAEASLPGSFTETNKNLSNGLRR